MAVYEVSVGRELLPGLLSGQDGLAKLVEAILNQIPMAQVAEALGAKRHERAEERRGLTTGVRLGELRHQPQIATLRTAPHVSVRIENNR